MRERPVTSPAVARALLREAGVRPSRSYGQNFLVDGNILAVIAREADLSADTTAIEVGAGLGALTELLVDRCRYVYALESDRRLIELLRRRLSEKENLELILTDASRFDFEKFKLSGCFREAAMVSNLPYRIAASIVVDCLIKYPWITAYTVMVQREVADRMTAKPGSKDYSSATVKIKSRARVARVAEVSRTCFFPRPLVDSALVRIDRLSRSLADEAGPGFDGVVRAAFSQRRKKLLSALRAGLDEDPGRVKYALASIGKEQARAEELSPEEFAQLAKSLGAGGPRREA